MIRRIILDLDDVLNQCTLFALQWVGCSVGPGDYHLYPAHVGYDIVGAANYLIDPSGEKEPAFTVSSFWNSIPRNFWATVPTSKEFGMVLGFAEQLVGQENVCIATSPTIDPDCHAGKVEWMQRVLPKWLRRQYQIGPCKQFFGMDEALMIDDSDKNVNKFLEWKGNHAILVPRPWNTNNRHNTMDYLNERFNELLSLQA